MASLPDYEKPALILRGVPPSLSDEDIQRLFATEHIPVASIRRLFDSLGSFKGILVVLLADPSPAAALSAAPRIARTAVDSGLKLLVGTVACDHCSVSSSKSAAVTDSTRAATAAPPMASVAAQSDPERLIFRGKQLWDPATADSRGSDVAGFIFFATSATFSECMSRMLLGMPSSSTARSLVQRMAPGPLAPTMLFLYHATQKALYGVLMPAARGGMNLEPDAWSSSGKSSGASSPYPAQVRVQVCLRFPLPLPRIEVERAIGNGPAAPASAAVPYSIPGSAATILPGGQSHVLPSVLPAGSAVLESPRRVPAASASLPIQQAGTESRLAASLGISDAPSARDAHEKPAIALVRPPHAAEGRSVPDVSMRQYQKPSAIPEVPSEKESLPFDASETRPSNRKERRRLVQRQYEQTQKHREVSSHAAAAQSSTVAGLHDDETLCIVCIDNPREVRLLPCGHLVLCKVCASALRFAKCPSCRAIISSYE